MSINCFAISNNWQWCSWSQYIFVVLWSTHTGNPSASRWECEIVHSSLASFSPCVYPTVFCGSNVTVTRTGTFLRWPKHQRAAVTLTLSLSVLCAITSALLLSSWDGRGCRPVPRPSPTGHLMVICLGPWCRAPGVNAERTSSGASQMTTSNHEHLRDIGTHFSNIQRHKHRHEHMRG